MIKQEAVRHLALKVAHSEDNYHAAVRKFQDTLGGINLGINLKEMNWELLLTWDLYATKQLFADWVSETYFCLTS